MKSTIYQHHLRASASFSYRHLLGSLHESALSVRHLGHWQNIDNLRPFAH